MSTLRFSKMQGLGNDFMVVDLVTQEAEFNVAQIRHWSDRRFGIGFDQLLVLAPPSDPDADFRFIIYNSDGSEAQHCGNGARCVGRFIAAEGLSPKSNFVLQMQRGHIQVDLKANDLVEVSMGVPILELAHIPFAAEHGTQIDQCRWHLKSEGGEATLVPVSMGNPHGVIMVDDVQRAAVETLGPVMESHPAFPEKANIGFCHVIDRGFLRLRVFERGVGETLACGSGACAAVVAGQLLGRLDRQVKVSLPGGKLRISWSGPGSPVRMTGPANHVYEGRIEL